MLDSSIAIIITLVTVILFITEKIPLWITALLSASAFVLTGILTVSQAFAGFSSSTVLMLIGIMIIGEAFFSTGFASIVGKRIVKSAGDDEKKLLLFLYIISVIVSIFFNAMLIVAVLMPVIDAAVNQSQGKMSRKQLYMPMAIGATLGGNLSVIGATCMLSASAFLEGSYFGRGLNFFESFPIAIAGCILVGLFYFLFGYKLQKKWFDFEDIGTRSSNNFTENEEYSKKKLIIISIVLVFCITCFVTQVIDMGITCIIGAMIVIITKCVDGDRVLKAVNWSAILLVVGALGVAKGLDVSGGGEIIAYSFIKLLGPFGESGFIMCAVLLVIASILSQVMSDNATVAIIVPIGLEVAEILGISPVPFVIAGGIGAVTAVATPLCNAPMTLTTVAGYRFKDYIRIGGLCSIVALVCALTSIYIVYFI